MQCYRTIFKGENFIDLFILIITSITLFFSENPRKQKEAGENKMDISL
jgi:hypothetical protein